MHQHWDVASSMFRKRWNENVVYVAQQKRCQKISNSTAVCYTKIGPSFLCYVKRFMPPTLSIPMQAERVLLRTDLPNSMHRLVASESFYSCSGRRFDSVTVENDEKHYNNCKNMPEFLVWFAKALMILTISFSSDWSQILRWKCTSIRELKVNSELENVKLCFV